MAPKAFCLNSIFKMDVEDGPVETKGVEFRNCGRKGVGKGYSSSTRHDSYSVQQGSITYRNIINL